MTYILINFKFFKDKKVSIWMNFSDLKVEDEYFFKFQLKSSFITCLILIVFVSILTYFNLSTVYLPIILIPFYISLYSTKYWAIKKGYLLRIS